MTVRRLLVALTALLAVAACGGSPDQQRPVPAQLFSASNPQPRQLVISFARGECDTVSSSAVDEDDEAVIVTIELSRSQDQLGKEVDCRDIAQVDTVTLPLQAPLDGRRIADPEGRDVPLA